MTTKEIEEKPNLGTYTNLGTKAFYLIEEEELPNFETLRNLETSERQENAKNA